MNSEEVKTICDEIKVSVTDKISVDNRKPCASYMDITFPPNLNLDYLMFQNHYTGFITVKQVFPKQHQDLSAGRKSDAYLYVTVLKKYKLMQNPHFENEAQNWHIIPTKLFNNKFIPDELKQLRIYLTQPSPSWKEFKLKHVQCFSIVSKELNPTEHEDDQKENKFSKFKERINSKLRIFQKKQHRTTRTTMDIIGPYDEIKKVDITQLH